MKLIRKLSIYWNLFGLHELVCIAAFCFSIYSLARLLAEHHALH